MKNLHKECVLSNLNPELMGRRVMKPRKNNLHIGCMLNNIKPSSGQKFRIKTFIKISRTLSVPQ